MFKRIIGIALVMILSLSTKIIALEPQVMQDTVTDIYWEYLVELDEEIFEQREELLIEESDDANPRDESSTIRIGVTRAHFDDVGSILRYFGNGVDFYILAAPDFRNVDTISGLYAIFINCGTQGVVDPEILRDFVYAGGVVYASDHASSLLIDAFPGILYHSSGTRQTVPARIVHSTLASHMGMGELDIIFDLGGWRPITQLTDDATIYIVGDVARLGRLPLAFSFDYGRGTVFYTSFHNSAQATGEMINFIEYLVFRIQNIEGDRDMAARAAREGFVYGGAVFGMLGAGETSDIFYYDFDGESDFMLMLGGGAEYFALQLIDPDGNVFDMDEFDADEYGIRLRAPAPGQWGFAVTALDNGGGNGAGGTMAPAPQTFQVGIATQQTTTNDTILTRADLAAWLAPSGLDDYAGSTATFADVPSTHPHFATIQWSAYHGIINGIGSGNFAPDSTLTLEQMAVMLYRYTYTIGLSLDADPAASLIDPANISPWALHAASVLYAIGIDISANPQAAATHDLVEQIITIFLTL